ncbi:polyribonucleotide nucleotidyltransferase [Bernardetia litoralis DSM 6794]|uniref:Polyribonucleotide nucleotidyltransferase n=1 Tax=Bernardetia litoralis (strain ATCC 23117 / DSM 6794 / NBRC 15988 / NCIMB 1366 / Fx l1 / Sio-4) TaxID=880071 RepID=I4ALZ6_BERLS|nr:polyribonucleotide nucleotidyltransferase [Bernardetia litoralis]AFM04981.1 polyribonucleotide nucleotidyltransferase [Bernardetia litoralis DSM 6794]
MKPNPIIKTVSLPDGREISVETGVLAKQASGAVVVRMGKTMLLATVVGAKEPREGMDFFPLSVDYQEKFASNGRIPGGFLKREGRLSDHEILVSRIIDRAVRPLFPDNYHNETQIMISLISADSDVLPDALAGFAASAAIAVSDLPMLEPMSEVRVIKLGEEYIINPTPAQMEEASLECIVAATFDNIMMVEGESKEVSEEDLLKAIQVAHETIKLQCTLQREMAEAVGNTVKREHLQPEGDEELEKMLHENYYQAIYDSVKAGVSRSKSERGEAIKAIKQSYIDTLPEDHEMNTKLIGTYFKKMYKSAARNFVLDEGTRLDGRKTNEVRPIWSEIDYLPSAHGSAVFTRGETQSLTTVTLGTKLDEQMIDGAMNSGYNRFILHYNFPAFSTGEARPNRGPGRREVGHGNLAMRALKNILPSYEDNPYTVRVVSDILESNGSSSMATVCAGSLALMDAGVSLKSPVSGIAMGMISDSETGKFAILSDILGDEDHLGDMDFKLTGTANGITAYQMDIKIDGLSYEVLHKALLQAKEGRLHILGEMSKTITEARVEVKDHAPRIHQIIIPRELIGAVIGPGGKIVQEIQRETGATITIEEVNNTGRVSIFATDKDVLNKAKSIVEEIVTPPEEGKTYEGTVKKITEFGAFVEFMKGKEGLLHISEITWERLPSMEGVLEEGEEIQVRLMEVDKRSGKYRLSRKVLLPKPEGYEERPPRNNDRGGSRTGGRDSRGGGRDSRPPRR